MQRQSIIAGLVGAGITVVVLLLAFALFFWAVTDPSGAADDEAQGPAPTAPTVPEVRSAPPTDLDVDEMWLDELALDAGTVVTPESVLHDVAATGRGVRSGPTGLVADWMSVDATVPFGVIAAELGEGITVRAADGNQATVLRTVQFAGRELDVVATGTVEVEGGTLVVEPRSIDIGGPSFLSGAIAAVVRRLVTIEHDIEGLPEGLVLQGVTVQDDGFRARLEGEDVRIVF